MLTEFYSLESLDYSIEQNTQKALNVYSSTSISNEGVIDWIASFAAGASEELSGLFHLFSMKQIFHNVGLEALANALISLTSKLRSAGHNGFASLTLFIGSFEKTLVGLRIFGQGIASGSRLGVENMNVSNEGIFTREQAQPLISKIMNSLKTIKGIFAEWAKSAANSGIVSKLASAFKHITGIVKSFIGKITKR